MKKEKDTIEESEDEKPREKCLHCKGKMVALRRVLDDGRPMGDTIWVCSNRGNCFSAFDIEGLKGSWEQTHDIFIEEA